MDLDLQRKVAVVTGAGKGIGLAAAKALADEGAQVVAGSLHTDGLDALKGITPVAVDLSAWPGAAGQAGHRRAWPPRHTCQQRRGGPHARRRILRHER